MNSGYKALAISILESAVKDIVKGTDERRKEQAGLFFKSWIGEFWCDIAGIDLATLQNQLSVIKGGNR
jgi:hypothetical protein